MTMPAIKMSNLWAMLTALLIGTLIGTMGNSIVSIAIPTLMEYYSIPLSSAVWSITLYTLTFSVLIPVFGSLSRAIGFKRMFIGGMVLTLAASLLCIIAPNYLIFLLARVMIGVGVATILPTIMGVISFYFPVEVQGRATGYWALVNSLGHAIGPTIGGFLLDHFAWQAIFWINIPLALLSILVAARVFRPDDRIPNKWFDWLGAAGMMVFVFAAMMGISQAGQNGWLAVSTLALLAVAVAALVFLLWYERRVDNPFINLNLFKKRDYISSIVPISLQAFTQFGLLVSLPVYLIDINGLEKKIAGMIIMTMTMMMAITSPIAGRLTDKFSSKWVCLGGTSLVGVGAVLMFALRSDQKSALGWAFFLLCLVIFGSGFGSIQSGSTVAAIQASPKEMVGAATGFFHMIRFISASLGSTIFGILLETSPQNTLGGFYNSFLLIIALALMTVPFTLWIAEHKAGKAASQRLEKSGATRS